MKYPRQKNQMDLIGSICSFDRKLYVEYFKNNSRKWLRTPKQKKQIGKIVGFGCNYNGVYVPEDKGFFDVDEYDSPHFIPSKRVPHIKVRIRGEGVSLKIHPTDCKIIKEKK